MARTRPGLLRRIGSAIVGKSVESGDNWFRRALDIVGLRGGQGALANVTRPYHQSWMVYAGVRAKARALAGLPFVIKRGNRSTKQGVQIDASDPAYGGLVTLFASPSPLVSAARLWEACSAHMDLKGEFFVIKIGKSSMFAKAREIPAELIFVNPKNVVLNQEDIDPKTRLVRRWWVGLDPQQQVSVPAESMVHHALLDPDATGVAAYRGMPPLDAAARGIAVEFKADNYAAAMLDNDCTPGGILQVDYEPNEKAVNQIKKRWKDTHQGAGRTGEIAVLGKGATYMQLAFSPREMLMPERHKIDLEQVKSVLGVTDFEMGTITDFNEATARTAERWFVKNTKIPLAHSIEDAFFSGLFRYLAVGGEDVWGEFDLSEDLGLLENLTEKVTQFTDLVNAGYTLDEVNDRLKLGMPEVGDRPMLGMGDGAIQVVGASPGGAITVGGKGDAAGGGAVSVVGSGGGVTIGRSARTQQVRRSRADWTGSTTAKLIAPHSSHRRAAASTTPRIMLPKNQRARAMRVFDQRAASLAKSALYKFFRNRRDAALAASGTKALDPISETELDLLLGAPSLWRQIAHDYLTEPMQRVALGAVRNAGRIIGGFDVVSLDDPTWLVQAAQRTAQMVRIIGRWRTRLRSAILEGVATDQSVTSLAQVIEREFGNVIASNGLVIARTETGMIAGQIRDQVFAAEGIDQKEWSATEDGHTRESHLEVNGEVIKAGETFSNGLRFPSDPSGPPEEIINCRCVAVPVA